ncbi:SPOR domain-containing protein [Oceaniglobus ichthyenteri]|uniref:SPOR domain-containing protein n=1 Tax=Oceaniglobus ichthyenteri TaxID=2136177 RepID=UPI000D3BF9C4|nr:SPOR domain-containing protein [Oceaniglobus ichthyenteri]
MNALRTSAFAIAAAFAMGFTISTPLNAQALSGNDQPAEFPPASYTARQYVDSKGCVFVRAGFDGAVSWVPRVNRSRKKLCGFKPTNVARVDAPVIADAPGTPPPSLTAPVRVARPVTAPVVAAQPRVVAPPPPAAAAPRVIAQAPVVRPAAPAARVATTAAPRTVRGTCPGASPISAQYINPGARCGPQAEHPAGGAQPVLRGGAGTVTAGPTPIALPSLKPAPVIAPPPGYRAAWTDDRLNPNRGKQTLSGALQTALIWTQTVPRRLVDNRGEDRTRDYNYLIYPYTDYARQKRDLAGGQHVTIRLSNGQRMIVHKSQLGVSKRTGQTVLRSDVNPTVSTKSVRAPAATVAKPAKQAAAGRYVQVGTFGNPGNAANTVTRLQRAGLPVRVGKVNRGGRTLEVVVAGPFASAQQVQNGLNIARRAGFGDAFVRK